MGEIYERGVKNAQSPPIPNSLIREMRYLAILEKQVCQLQNDVIDMIAKNRAEKVGRDEQPKTNNSAH